MPKKTLESFKVVKKGFKQFRWISREFLESLMKISKSKAHWASDITPQNPPFHSSGASVKPLLNLNELLGHSLKNSQFFLFFLENLQLFFCDISWEFFFLQILDASPYFLSYFPMIRSKIRDSAPKKSFINGDYFWYFFGNAF